MRNTKNTGKIRVDPSFTEYLRACKKEMEATTKSKVSDREMTATFADFLKSERLDKHLINFGRRRRGGFL
jgi:hypothetical protein